jgi:hypothetical protein
VHLTGPTGAIASAVLTTRGGITYVDLTATGLDPSQSYGVWLQGNDGARASAGTFQPAGPGTVRIALTSAAQLSDALMFGVSTVPQPGESAGIDILATRL